MKYSAVLPLVAGASAFVIPDEATAKEVITDGQSTLKQSLSNWWEQVPSADELRTSAEDIFNNAVDAFEYQANKLHNHMPEWEFDIESEISDFLPVSLLSTHTGGEDKNGHVGKPGHHGTTNLTVYQSIQASKFTTKFAKWVNEFPDVVKQLNSTDANVTVFAPTDKAFEKIPDGTKEPPKEFLERALKYHILPGSYPAGRVLAHHTLPTALEETELGGHPQRLRASVGIFGLRLNFYSKVVVANLYCKNGVAHGVDSILVPPPPAEKVVSLFPSRFSTLLLAAEKTGLHKGDDVETRGLTIFAPTNWAFQKLGPAANAFLFNTEKGAKYLRALILYHSVVDETLYSDAYYGKKASKSLFTSEDEAETNTGGVSHVDLPTALGEGKRLSVDIARYFGFITMRVNGFTKVATQDGIAKDGVVQVVDSVLLPPHKHKGEYIADNGEEMDVQELIERLEPNGPVDSAEEEL